MKKAPKAKATNRKKSDNEDADLFGFADEASGPMFGAKKPA